MRLVLIAKLLVAILGLSLATLAPAYAGAKETALLASFAGSWAGKGVVTGPDAGKVSCRLSFKATKSGGLSYTGRCSFGIGQTSFRGGITYNDAKKRYEATSTTQGIDSSVIGKKSGDGITFSSSGMDTRYGSASSTMVLTGRAIKLSFKLVDKKSEVTESSITFSKS